MFCTGANNWKVYVVVGKIYVVVGKIMVNFIFFIGIFMWDITSWYCILQETWNTALPPSPPPKQIKHYPSTSKSSLYPLILYIVVWYYLCPGLCQIFKQKYKYLNIFKVYFMKNERQVKVKIENIWDFMII